MVSIFGLGLKDESSNLSIPIVDTAMVNGIKPLKQIQRTNTNNILVKITSSLIKPSNDMDNGFMINILINKSMILFGNISNITTK